MTRLAAIKCTVFGSADVVRGPHGLLRLQVSDLKTVVPPGRDIWATSGCPNAHPKGRSEAEHSERSGELCGWALVAQSAIRGGTKSIVSV
jgi:hypothetical protein